MHAWSRGACCQGCGEGSMKKWTLPIFALQKVGVE
jgi:hypothetical protein